jgi:23S rRNA pseudouridine2605 synthase
MTNVEDITNEQGKSGERIAKVIARAGLASRREAEAWIAAGRVTVNGKVLESPACNVTDEDDVRVDGKKLSAPERTRLFLFHKPRGLVTTARDPEGRPTIFDALPPDLPRLVAVGRLDINTEGLMLLTNDGGLARVLELPSTGWLRRYRVRAHGRIDQAGLDGLSEGVTVDGIDYAGIEARLDREQGSNAWITMGLREGKNREIKRVLEHLGLAVNRLIRVSFGPFELGDLAEGEIAEVRTRVLRDQLGAKLAREAGVDLDAPIIYRAPPAEAPREDRRRRPEGAGKARGAGLDRGRDDAPRRGPPTPSTSERRRKHVSVLRKEIAADATGPRKRIARGATKDRKGRTIAVERVSRAGPEPESPAAPAKRGPGKGPRRRRTFEAERELPERPRRPDSFEVKRARDGEGRERPPRAERRKGAAGADAGAQRAGKGKGAPRSRRAQIAEGEPVRSPRLAPRPGGGAARRGRNGAPHSAARSDGAGDRGAGMRGGKPKSGGRKPSGSPPKGASGPRRPPRKR